MVASQVAQAEPPPALLTALELLSRLLSHNPATSIAAICPQLNALLEFCFNTRWVLQPLAPLFPALLLLLLLPS